MFKATAALHMYGAPETYCWIILNPTKLLSHPFLTHAVMSLIETAGLLWALRFTCSQRCVLAECSCVLSEHKREVFDSWCIWRIQTKGSKNDLTLQSQYLSIKTGPDSTERLRTFLLNRLMLFITEYMVCASEALRYKNSHLQSTFLHNPHTTCK